jgi:hypothetical protein
LSRLPACIGVALHPRPPGRDRHETKRAKLFFQQCSSADAHLRHRVVPPELPPLPQNHRESPNREASCRAFLQWEMCVAGSRVSPPLPADLRLALQRPPPHNSVPLRPSRSRPRGRCLPPLITRVCSLSPHTTLLLAGNCGVASMSRSCVGELMVSPSH